MQYQALRLINSTNYRQKTKTKVLYTIKIGEVKDILQRHFKESDKNTEYNSYFPNQTEKYPF